MVGSQFTTCKFVNFVPAIEAHQWFSNLFACIANIVELQIFTKCVSLLLTLTVSDKEVLIVFTLWKNLTSHKAEAFNVSLTNVLSAPVNWTLIGPL